MTQCSPRKEPQVRNLPESWTFVDGEWREGDTPLYGAMSHASWLGSSVFDGARAFDGRMPDLDLHCARVVASAQSMGMNAPVTTEELVGLAQEGAAKFAAGAALYIRPMVWAEAGGAFMIPPDPESSKFCMTLWAAPMLPASGFSITTTRFRRPTIECMPTDAKAGCLYPNNARMIREAQSKGADNALVCDMLGNVAELATSNVFLVKDGVVMTPAPNGTFLNGITRQRVIALLRSEGVEVRETLLSVEDFREADEVFSTGNYGKVVPVTRFDERDYGVGPTSKRARELYWDFAKTGAAGAA
ncbi:MAG: branched-chain amino acid aminotransferase [Pseudomonadota bacterium]